MMFEPQRSYTHDGQVFVGLGRKPRKGEPARYGLDNCFVPSCECDHTNEDCGFHPCSFEALAPVPFQPGQGQLTGWRYKIEEGELAYREWCMGDDWLACNNRGEPIGAVNYASLGPPANPPRKRYIMERDEPDKPVVTEATEPVVMEPDECAICHQAFQRGDAKDVIHAACAKAMPDGNGFQHHRGDTTQPDYAALLRRWQATWANGRIIGADYEARREMDALFTDTHVAFSVKSPPPAAPCSHERKITTKRADGYAWTKCLACGVEIESAHVTGRRRADWVEHTNLLNPDGDKRRRDTDQRVDDNIRRRVFNGEGVRADSALFLAAEAWRDAYRAGVECGKGAGNG